MRGASGMVAVVTTFHGAFREKSRGKRIGVPLGGFQENVGVVSAVDSETSIYTASLPGAMIFPIIGAREADGELATSKRVIKFR